MVELDERVLRGNVPAPTLAFPPPLLLLPLLLLLLLLSTRHLLRIVSIWAGAWRHEEGREGGEGEGRTSTTATREGTVS